MNCTSKCIHVRIMDELIIQTCYCRLKWADTVRVTKLFHVCNCVGYLLRKKQVLTYFISTNDNQSLWSTPWCVSYFLFSLAATRVRCFTHVFFVGTAELFIPMTQMLLQTKHQLKSYRAEKLVLICSSLEKQKWLVCT